MAEEQWLTDGIFVVHQLFSPHECERFVQISEDVGYEDALLTSPNGNVLRKDIRNNQRVMFKNDEFADSLWVRASDFVPSEIEGRAAVGVNELLRFYRYDPGQRFNWHQDFAYERDNGEKSFLTFLIYLNEGFEGGETSFEDSYSDDPFEPFSVTPQLGTALFFEHQTHHAGELVRSGRKYVLRSDVMYAAEEVAQWDEYEDRWD